MSTRYGIEIYIPNKYRRDARRARGMRAPTHEDVRTIANAWANGAPLELCAALVGESKSTLMAWMHTGQMDREKGECSVYQVLVAGMLIGKAKRGAQLLEVIVRSALRGNTSDVKWLLEHQWPGAFDGQEDYSEGDGDLSLPYNDEELEDLMVEIAQEVKG